MFRAHDLYTNYLSIQIEEIIADFEDHKALSLDLSG